jgi:hypothetical protein
MMRQAIGPGRTDDIDIGLDGIKIDRNPELLGKGVYGFTDGKAITLYPDAFAKL